MEKFYFLGTLNDNSIDDNSNKNEKVFRNWFETTAPVIKAIGYDYLYRMLVNWKKEAKKINWGNV